jgi:hypothetical protein
MAGGLQLATTTFRIGKPDTHGIFAEKHDGKDVGVTPKILHRSFCVQNKENYKLTTAFETQRMIVSH